ncbi:MAG: hypothetical protein WC755_03565 [Candidatus Woesearchaeota archaeon]|jgi:hypothetical protein
MGKKELEQMIEFALNKPSLSGFIHKNKVLVGNKETHYLIKSQETNPESVIVLADRTYTENDFRSLINKLSYHDYAVLFYKDGKKYFRCGLNRDGDLMSLRRKQFDNRSLKHYTDEQLRRSITLAHPERIIQERKDKISYYQPESERLEEEIISFVYKPIVFDYSHIPASQRFGPVQQESKQYFEWIRKIEHNGTFQTPFKRLTTDNDLITTP